MKLARLFLLFVLTLALSELSADGYRLWRGNAKKSGTLATITGTGTFYKSYAVKPGKDYLFSADMVSNGVITIQIRGKNIAPAYSKRIAYNGFGKKQKVCGFYNSRNSDVLIVEINIGKLKDKNVKTSITNINFEQTDLKSYVPVPRPGITPVTKLGKDTIIVIPEGKFYQDLAQKISKKISPAPRILTDKQVCESNQPTIRKEYAGKDLIILGNLDTNKAIWPAYNNMLAASDAYYPGAQGYEIRTAVDVLNNGRNHIIIGSSSPEGVKLAVEKFLPQIRKELPFLLDVKLSGKCLETVNADIAKWKTFPRGGGFPQKEAGYHTIRRWYHNAIMYYWTGHDFYKEMARKLFPPVLADNAYTHHYIMEWLFKTWRMVKYTGLHTPEEAKRAEKLLFYNFMELQTGADLYWFRFWTPPYEKIIIGSRHVTAPLLCLIETSDYVKNNYKMPAKLQQLAQFVHDESARALRGVSMTQRSEFITGGHIEGIQELILRIYSFSLKYGHYDFFRSGKAIEWNHFVFLDQSNCRNSVIHRARFNDKHIASILAAYYRSPGFQYLRDTGSYPVNGQGMFNDRFICGIGLHSSSVKAARPAELDRPVFWMLSPTDRLNSRYLNRLTYRLNPQTLKKNPIEFAALRRKEGRNQVYLGIFGMKRDLPVPGEIVQFTYNKVAWLHNWWTGLYSNMLGNAFERNALFINRNMQPDNAVGIFNPLASMEWGIDLPGVQAVNMLFTGNNGVDWSRSIYMIDTNRFIVYDGVKVNVPDYYDLCVTWRPHQTPMPNTADTLFAKYRKDIFSINCSGKGFSLETNTKNYIAKHSPRLNSHFSFHGNLKKGDKVAAAALLQVNGKSRIAEIGNGRVLLIDNDKVSGVFTFSAAGASEISRRRIVLTNSDKVVFNGKTLWKNSKKSNLLWDLKNGVIYTAFDKQIKVSDQLNKQAQAAVAAYLRSFKIPAAAGTVSSKSSVAEKKSLAKLWSRNPMIKRDAVVNIGFWPYRKFYTFPEPIMLSEVWSLDTDREIPKTVEVSLDGKKWTKLQLKPEWLSGQLVRNYGETHPIAKSHQTAFVKPAVKTKYLRTSSLCRLQFSRSDKKVPNREVKIYGTYPDILVSNVIHKSWPRRYYSETNTVVLLDKNGKELFSKEIRGGLHELKYLDYPAANSIGMARADSRLHFFDRSGKLLKEINVYDDLKKFNARYGRKGMRHPASGFAAPYALGSWRNGQLVVTRYGHFNFYDKAGKLIGVNHGGTYGMANILSKGKDLNGDGVEDIVSFGPNHVVTVSGTPKARVQSPGSHIYWPEVFSVFHTSYPIGWSDLLGTAGPPYSVIQRFEMGNKDYLFLATLTFVGVFDCSSRRFIWTTICQSPLLTGTAVQLSKNSWKAAVSMESGVVTIYTWNKDPLNKETIKVVMPDEITALTMTPAGKVFAAGRSGIYEIVGNKAVRCLKGCFTDVKYLSGGKLVTASKDGTISCWKIK